MLFHLNNVSIVVVAGMSTEEYHVISHTLPDSIAKQIQIPEATFHLKWHNYWKSGVYFLSMSCFAIFDFVIVLCSILLEMRVVGHSFSISKKTFLKDSPKDHRPRTDANDYLSATHVAFDSHGKRWITMIWRKMVIS